jgi:mannose-6-phosphate isomerase-like protein (cupin superfamily)
MSAQLNSEAPLEGAVKPQLFSLKTAMVSTGMIDNFVSETDLMKVSIKIYAEGGENFLHTHMAEDHYFVILEGEATFVDPEDHKVTLHKHQGIMLPRGCYYMFTNTGATPVVMLRCAATAQQPWVKDSRKWWQGVKDTRVQNRDGSNVIPGKFFAEGSELPASK